MYVPSRNYPNRPFFLCRSAPHSLYDWLHRRLVRSPWPEESAAANSPPRRSDLDLQRGRRVTDRTKNSHCSSCVRQRRLIGCPRACLRRREVHVYPFASNV
ncbi:hypothetical protein SEVIR_8G232700v4 [Setaria viridis]